MMTIWDVLRSVESSSAKKKAMLGMLNFQQFFEDFTKEYVDDTSLKSCIQTRKIDDLISEELNRICTQEELDFINPYLSAYVKAAKLDTVKKHSPKAVEEMAASAKKCLDENDRKNLKKDFDAALKELEKSKNKQKAAVIKPLKECFNIEDLQEKYPTFESILYGIMSTLMENTLGAAETAFSFSIHECFNEVNSGVATDDVVAMKGEKGAAHLYDQEMNSSINYEYTAIDAGLVFERLKPYIHDREKCIRATRALIKKLIEMFILVVPGAGQNASSSRECPILVVIEVANNKNGAQNGGAFINPVAGKDLGRKGVQCMLDHLSRKANTMTLAAPVERYWTCMYPEFDEEARERAKAMVVSDVEAINRAVECVK